MIKFLLIIFYWGGDYIMERKKLYKAKKNWVIGLVVGFAVMTMGTINVQADATNITSSQQLSNTEMATSQMKLANAQTIVPVGMSTNVAINPVGSYNKENVGYINPNSEVDIYNN